MKPLSDKEVDELREVYSNHPERTIMMPYQYLYENVELKPYIDWCLEFLKYHPSINWDGVSTYFIFESEEDAMAFKLTFDVR